MARQAGAPLKALDLAQMMLQKASQSKGWTLGFLDKINTEVTNAIGCYSLVYALFIS